MSAFQVLGFYSELQKELCPKQESKADNNTNPKRICTKSGYDFSKLDVITFILALTKILSVGRN